MDPQTRFATAWTALIVAVAIDLLSVVLTTRRLRSGGGPSGIHGVASVFYLGAVLFTFEPVVLRYEPFWLFKLLEVGMLLGFHLFLSVLLPDLLRKEERRGGSPSKPTDNP